MSTERRGEGGGGTDTGRSSVGRLLSVAVAVAILSGCGSGAVSKPDGSVGPGGDSGSGGLTGSGGRSSAAGAAGTAAVSGGGGEAGASLAGTAGAGGGSAGGAAGGSAGSGGRLGGGGAGGASSTSGTCAALASYGSPTFGSRQVGSEAYFITSYAEAGVFWRGALNSANQPDVLEIDLNANVSPFASMIAAPSTVDLGSQSQASSCGACVYIYTKVQGLNLPATSSTQTYLATGGTLTLTTTPPTPAQATSHITGTLANVTFQHVNVDSSGVSTAIDGCTAAIDAASFDAVVTNSSI